MASELVPVVARDRLHAFERFFGIFVALYGSLLPPNRTCHDRQPAQNGEDSVLLANIVGAEPKALLSADKRMVVLLPQLLAVHQIAEEFPARRHFKAANPASFAHHIDRRGRRHRSRARRQTALEVRNASAVRSHHRQRVGRRDKELAAQNHRTVRISVCHSVQAASIPVAQPKSGIFAASSGDLGTGWPVRSTPIASTSSRA